MIYTAKEIIHKIIDWLGLEWTFKIPCFQPPCHDREPSTLQTRLLSPIHLLMNLQEWGVHNLSEQQQPLWTEMYMSGRNSFTRMSKRADGWLKDLIVVISDLLVTKISAHIIYKT